MEGESSSFILTIKMRIPVKIFTNTPLAYAMYGDAWNRHRRLNAGKPNIKKGPNCESLCDCRLVVGFFSGITTCQYPTDRSRIQQTSSSANDNLKFIGFYVYGTKYRNKINFGTIWPMGRRALGSCTETRRSPRNATDEHYTLFSAKTVSLKNTFSPNFLCVFLEKK